MKIVLDAMGSDSAPKVEVEVICYHPLTFFLKPGDALTASHSRQVDVHHRHFGRIPGELAQRLLGARNTIYQAMKFFEGF